VEKMKKNLKNIDHFQALFYREVSGSLETLMRHPPGGMLSSTRPQGFIFSISN
jgi:hypothetical protein